MKKLALVLFVLTSPAWAVLTFVQCANGISNGINTVSATISTTAGNLVVVSTKENTDSAHTWTLTDSLSQSYTQAGIGYSDSGGTNANMDIRYVANSGGITSVTATFSGVTASNTIIACEFSGAAPSNPEDTSVKSGINSFVNTLTSGTYTTTNPTDLLFHCHGNDASIGAGSYTYDTGNGWATMTNATPAGLRHTCQYKIVSTVQSAQTTVVTWTGNATKDASVTVALKAAPVQAGHRPFTF